MNRAFRRNRIPRLHIGVADTFFCILTVSNDIIRQNKQSSAVGVIHMLDAVLISGKEHFYDLAVFHLGHLISIYVPHSKRPLFPFESHN